MFDTDINIVVFKSVYTIARIALTLNFESSDKRSSYDELL